MLPHPTPVYTSPLHHACHMPRPSHLLDLIIRIIFNVQDKSWNS
jgi:hypothetical protein